MDGVQLPQGLSHFEEAVYFLPLSSQNSSLKGARSLYVSKENQCFDKFLTKFPDGSYLDLSAFIIVRYILKVFALFLGQNSVPLTNRCCSEYGLLRRRPPGHFLARDILPYSQYV